MTTSTKPSQKPGGEPYLVLDQLSVKFPSHDGAVHAVSDLSYSVSLGKTLGIVGESGSGKSVSSMAVLGLHNQRNTQLSGSIRLDGVELLNAPASTMNRIRGRDVSMIFQDPMTSLHPFFKVGAQIAEAYRLHNKVSRKVAKRRAVEMLDLVGIPQPDRRADEFPHQFSGGMRQRAMIAVALVNNPKVLIADEPTTALDVTVQAQILDLIREMQQEFGSAVILITHDLGVVAEVADEVLIMYAGRCVERGPCQEILSSPQMPYTWGLLSSIPDRESDPNRPLLPIPGTPPSLLTPPSGCSFHPRCAFVDRVDGERCSSELPQLAPAGGTSGHLRRCHLQNPDEIYREQSLEQA